MLPNTLIVQLLIKLHVNILGQIVGSKAANVNNQVVVAHAIKFNLIWEIYRHASQSKKITNFAIGIRSLINVMLVRQLIYLAKL